MNEKAEKDLQEIEKLASLKARNRANTARWSLEVAVFLVAVLIIIIILLFQGFGVEFIGPVALLGLSLVWLMGWMQGKKLYKLFLEEEMKALQRTARDISGVEETIEEQVKRLFRKNWQE